MGIHCWYYRVPFEGHKCVLKWDCDDDCITLQLHEKKKKGKHGIIHFAWKNGIDFILIKHLKIEKEKKKKHPKYICSPNRE